MSNLENVIEQTKTILEDLLPFLPYDVYEKVVIEQREAFKSNIETTEWTVKFYLNDGIGDLQNYNCGNYIKEYHETSHMNQNYNNIYNIIDAIFNSNNIVMEKWDKQSYISFNLFNKKVNKNIVSVCLLNKSYEIELKIGEDYYLFLSQIEPESLEKFKLKEIKKEQSKKELFFESETGKTKTLRVDTAKGYVSTNKQNIDRLQSHTIIEKRISTFVESVMFLLEEELSFGLKVKDLPAYLTKISELIKEGE
jgi:hypothetical protein